MEILQRPRRNRRSEPLRSLLRESTLAPADFVWPLFVVEGKGKQEPIASMPGVSRWSVDLLVERAREARAAGITAVALFPAIDAALKDSFAREALNKDGLVPRAVKALKDAVPELVVITDVALDPYSSDGHDGLVENGRILNDPTLEVLAQMALVQAAAGADIVAPSDMMDGRVGVLRKALDAGGFQETGILAYTAKYASAFYGPFRDALSSAPRFGDKKTYQMDPSNAREALRELELDQAEGADLVMVKPAGAYLDVIRMIKDRALVPVAAYQVSGEYAMIQAAAQNGWIDGPRALMESLMAIKRAGADVILSYYALEAARTLSSKS
jgi:porphobilinogen synthase